MNGKVSSALVALALVIALVTPVHQAICNEQQKSMETCHLEDRTGSVKPCCPSVTCQPEQYLAKPRAEKADVNVVALSEFPRAMALPLAIPSLFRSEVIQRSFSLCRAVLCTLLI